MDKVWEALRILLDEADKDFCTAVFVSFTVMTARTLTRLAISKTSRNPKFRKLYREIRQSAAATYLVEKLSPNIPEFPEDHLRSFSANQAPNRIDGWNFEINTIKLNPLINLFRNETLTYVSPTLISPRLLRIHFCTIFSLN